jgi:hypothetical protein
MFIVYLHVLFRFYITLSRVPSWPWSYGSWIYNYLCNQCILPLMVWVRISIRVRCTTLCDRVRQWLTTGRWFSPGPSVCSNNKTDCHDITEILIKVALNTIKKTNKQTLSQWFQKSSIFKLIFVKISLIYIFLAKRITL